MEKIQINVEIKAMPYQFIVFNEENKNIVFELNSDSSIIPIKYLEKYDLNGISKIDGYFKKMKSIKDIIKIIISLIKNKKYSLKPSDDLTQITLILKPNEKKTKNIEIIIPINIKNNNESNDDKTYELLLKMDKEIDEIDKKVNELSNNSVKVEQVSDINSKIDFLYTKLSKNHKGHLNINEDENFFNKVHSVLSNEILISNNNDLDLIKYFIDPQKIKENIKLSLIYKATHDSDNSKKFHEKCDNHSPTLILIKGVQGNRFGGYTTQPWNCNELCKIDNEAFLFNLDYKKKYNICENCPCAIYCKENFCPAFGEGFDLFLSDNFFSSQGNYSKFPSSYGIGTPKNELTGNNLNFNVKEVEVYQVIFENN